MTHQDPERLQKTAHLAMVNLQESEETAAEKAFEALHTLAGTLPETAMLNDHTGGIFGNTQLRLDEVQPSLQRELLLSQAPHAQNGLILARRAFEEDETC